MNNPVVLPERMVFICPRSIFYEKILIFILSFNYLTPNSKKTSTTTAAHGRKSGFNHTHTHPRTPARKRLFVLGFPRQGTMQFRRRGGLDSRRRRPFVKHSEHVGKCIRVGCRLCRACAVHHVRVGEFFFPCTRICVASSDDQPAPVDAAPTVLTVGKPATIDVRVTCSDS